MLHHCGKACVCHDSSSLPLSRAVIDEPNPCTQGLGGWDMRLDEPKPRTLVGQGMSLVEPNPGPSVGGVQP